MEIQPFARALAAVFVDRFGGGAERERGFHPQPLEKTLEERSKFLRHWRSTGRLVCSGNYRNLSNAVVLVPAGPLDEVRGLRPRTHHRSPTKAERRRARRHQARLRSVTLRSLHCAQQGKSSSQNWLGT